MNEPYHRIVQDPPAAGSAVPGLFTPLTIRGVTLRNRVMLSPMCMYSARDGAPTDWHFVHLGARAMGGVGLVMTEAAAVEDRGRISLEDLGIWSDEHVAPLRRLTAMIAGHGATPGIQLAHAGRKGSANAPWVAGPRPIPPSQGGWVTVGPSAVAFSDAYPPPHALTESEIAGVVQAFGAGAGRAREAGFRVIEIQACHGYLLHEFLSPIANMRTDRYGGSFENRVRIVDQVVDAVRGEWPADLPLFVRLSSTDWFEDRPSWRLPDSIRLATELKPRGVDLFDCSSASIVPNPKFPIGPGYQVRFAEAIRNEAGVLTSAVGLITEPELANEIITSGRADLVTIGRALLEDPNWTYRAARELGVPPEWPVQYPIPKWEKYKGLA